MTFKEGIFQHPLKIIFKWQSCLYSQVLHQLNREGSFSSSHLCLQTAAGMNNQWGNRPGMLHFLWPTAGLTHLMLPNGQRQRVTFWEVFSQAWENKKICGPDKKSIFHCQVRSDHHENKITINQVYHFLKRIKDISEILIWPKPLLAEIFLDTFLHNNNANNIF